MAKPKQNADKAQETLTPNDQDLIANPRPFTPVNKPLPTEQPTMAPKPPQPRPKAKIVSQPTYTQTKPNVQSQEGKNLGPKLEDEHRLEGINESINAFVTHNESELNDEEYYQKNKELESIINAKNSRVPTWAKAKSPIPTPSPHLADEEEQTSAHNIKPSR